MRKTIVVCSSNRLMEHQTSVAIQDLVHHHGACFIEQRGTNDVAFARNLALTRVLSVLEQSDYDVVLMVDDDMIFSAEQVLGIVGHVRETRHPASGSYILPDGRIAATHIGNGRWLTGLGFLAIPRECLQQVAAGAKKFRPFRGADHWMIEFTRSCADVDHNGELHWEPEDSRLTRSFGGVELLPIAVGHVKKNVLWPDATKLGAFIAAEIAGSVA